MTDEMAKERGLGVYLHQIATTNYPLTFEKASSVREGLLLEGDQEQYYLLSQFAGNQLELQTSLEAEKYLENRGFSWLTPAIPLTGGSSEMVHGGQNYYLKDWQAKNQKPTYRWQMQLGSEILAKVHLLGENFQPQTANGWEWPDWMKLFEMARDTIYELHTTITSEQEKKLIKYFDQTAKDAILAMEDAIVHLKEIGYDDQRTEGMRKGFINLSQVPGINPGLKFDLLVSLNPDLPSCGLGSFLGQIGDWKKKIVINDVIDLIDAYNRIRKLSTDEIDLVKGFLKFPWKFWWATEEFFPKNKLKKKGKRYAKELKSIRKSKTLEIQKALQEL